MSVCIVGPSPADGSIVITFYVNDAATPIVITIPPGSPAGVYRNAVNSIPLSANDLIRMHVVNNSPTTVTPNFGGIGVELTGTGTSRIIGGFIDGPVTVDTWMTPMCDNLSTFENLHMRLPLPYDCNIIGFRVNVITSVLPPSGSLVFRVNGTPELIITLLSTDTGVKVSPDTIAALEKDSIDVFSASAPWMTAWSALITPP